MLGGDGKAARELVANDVPDMLAHLREAQQSTGGTVEYATATKVAGANNLAAEGYRLHSVVSAGTDVWFVMVRGGDADLREQRDAALSRLADAEWRLQVLSRQVETLNGSAALIPGPANDNALIRERDQLREERDRLALQVQRVRNLPGRNSDGHVSDYLPRASVLAALDGGQS